MVVIDVDDFCESVENNCAPVQDSTNRLEIDWNESDGILQDKEGSRVFPVRTRDTNVYEAGKAWGEVSRKDIICFFFAMLLLIAGIVTAFVILLTPEAETITPDVPTMGTNASDAFPNSAQHTYDTIRQAIQDQLAPKVAEPILLRLPPDLNTLPSNDIYHQALIWLLSSATMPEQSELLSRFVLGLTFYNNGGTNWMQREHWMTSQPVCSWYGMRCQGKYITEVDLSNNALVGPIHPAWTLLTNCSSILLNANAITGTIPGEVFGNMQSLEYLYLKNNQLSGTVPNTLLTAGTLGKYRVMYDCNPRNNSTHRTRLSFTKILYSYRGIRSPDHGRSSFARRHNLLFLSTAWIVTPSTVPAVTPPSIALAEHHTAFNRNHNLRPPTQTLRPVINNQ
jgi:hypothetical protein